MNTIIRTLIVIKILLDGFKMVYELHANGTSSFHCDSECPPLARRFEDLAWGLGRNLL